MLFKSFDFSRWVVVVSALLLSFSINAQPLALAKYVVGTHYDVLAQPKKIVPDDKIEVMEVFWYGCSHCFSFEPYITNWKKTISDDVAFMRTPAVWAKPMEAHAALYYATELLDTPPAVHNDLFVLLTNERRLVDEKRFAAVFAKHGIEEETFLKAYKSFGIKSKVKQAKARAQSNYATEGTPEIIVNGKYRVTISKAGGPDAMLDVVDYLIGLERS